MVPVSDPANACDPHEEGTLDNAISPPASGQGAGMDKDVIRQIETDADPAPSIPGQTDPAALAARILQRSAVKGVPLQKRARTPELLWDDNHRLEIPDALVSHGARMLDPDQRAARRHRLQPAQYGPSFKALLFSTLLIIAAGSGAIALGLPEMMADTDSPSKIVQTETITAVPKENRKDTLETSFQDIAPANPNQVKKATDRIRQAFAETGAPKPGKPIHLTGRTGTADLPLHPSRSTPPVVEPLSPPPVTGILPEDPAPAAPLPASSAPVLPDKDGAPDGAASDKVPDWDAPNTGTVTASVNLRAADDKNGKIIGVVPEGTEVSYSSCGKWWCEVVYDGTTGFVGQKYLRR